MKPVWLHLGLGAFFRAHGCTYIADAGGWDVVGVSLRSPTVRDRLAPQSFAYTASALTDDGVVPRQINVLRDVLVGTQDMEAVLGLMAAPETQIVSLTVTEKGYCLDPATGTLNLDHPDIRHDLTADLPRSAIGVVARGLQARRLAGLGPVTVMSCDNLTDNGARLKAATLAFAEQVDPGLVRWITDHGAFPNTMVDRIVPATTDSDIAAIRAATGHDDAAPVLHEPFRQWVIEDHFAGDRPALETVGAQFVRDVAPFEAMKLRMLNGAHSAIAYLGGLAGHRTVAAAMEDADMVRFLRGFWAEVGPTLPGGLDLTAYTKALEGRFANKGLAHQTRQIAMDGSQKVPLRWLGSLSDGVNGGHAMPHVILALAGWVTLLKERDETGAAFALNDPLADTLRGASVDDVLALRDVFDTDLAQRVAEPLRAAVARIGEIGAQRAMREVAG